MIAGSNDLTVLDQASRILAEAKSLDDIKAIRDKAEAARAYVKAAKLGLELQNRAAEVKLRAERKAGGLLRLLKLRGGDRKSKFHRDTLKLEELGVTKLQSMRWQRVAAISERDFSAYLQTANKLWHEVTSAGLLRSIAKCHNLQRSGCVPTRDATASKTSSVGVTEANEIILELYNHCQLLTNILRPVYEEDQIQFERAERRIVVRLLGEMMTLILHLQDEWPNSILGSSPLSKISKAVYG